MTIRTKTLVVGGLLAVLGSGCENNDVSAVGETIYMAKPKDCEKVIDFSRVRTFYNLHCEEGGKSVFYFRTYEESAWTRVIFTGGN